MDRFDGVLNISFQGPFLNDEDDLTSRLFKLAKSVSTHTYCLVPIDVPGTNSVWDMTYLSNADLMVWRFVIAIASSTGSMLFELVGTLRNAPLPSSYPIGMKVRLDTSPSKFLVGVQGFAAAAEAVRLALGVGATVASISPGKPAHDSTVLRKTAGCLVDDLNGDPYTLRNKAGGSERIARVGGALRECGRSRMDRLLSDLNFVVRDFKGQCVRQSTRVDLPDGDEMLTFTQLKSVTYLEIWLNDAMFTTCFLGLDDGLDWSVSLANFISWDKCLWGPNFDYRGLQRLMEAARNFSCFMTIFKGAVYTDIFEELFIEFTSKERRLENYHVDFIWAVLEDVIRSYGHEVRHTQGKVAKNYGIGQPIASPADCSNFFKYLLHEQLEALRAGKWPVAPHTVYREKVMSLVHNRLEFGAHIVAHGPVSTPAAVTVQLAPLQPLSSTQPTDRDGEVKGHVHHQSGTCVWHLAGALGLVSRTSGKPYQCHDPSKPDHKPLSEIKHSDALKLVGDKGFMRFLRSSAVQKNLREAVKDQVAKFAR